MFYISSQHHIVSKIKFTYGGPKKQHFKKKHTLLQNPKKSSEAFYINNQNQNVYKKVFLIRKQTGKIAMTEWDES